jgi:hypothetical protein
LPADASELQRAAAGDPAFPRWLAAAAVFLVGSTAGVAATLGWQAMFPPAEVADDDRPPPVVVAAAPLLPQPAPPRQVEVAPPPHEPAPPSPPEREVAPAPRAAAETPLPSRVIIELNDPDLSYALPSTLRKAPWVVLRGKVKSLKVNGLNSGQVLDASGLEAASVTVSGRIDHRATLKVNAPGGTVSVTAAVSGRSTVAITAPGGTVQFPSKPNRAGSQIDGGSTVAITARRVDLRGDVDGAGTRVTVTLTGDGWLWAAAVRGAAAVEYRTANGQGKPGASAGTVAPTATFRQRD